MSGIASSHAYEGVVAGKGERAKNPEVGPKSSLQAADTCRGDRSHAVYEPVSLAGSGENNS